MQLERFAKSALQPENKAEVSLQRIKAQENKVAFVAQLIDAQIQQDVSASIDSLTRLFQSLESPLSRMSAQAALFSQQVEENDYLEMLHWLSSIPYSKHHERYSEDRLPDTGQWLLHHPQYLQWMRSSSSSIFLLSGIVGSGKTSLTSLVVGSYLNHIAQPATLAPIAYFYCTKSSSEIERSDTSEIMRSLARQLGFWSSQPRTVRSTIKFEFERCKDAAKLDGFPISKLSTGDCVKMILDLAATDSVTIVVDALDEVPDNDRYELVQAFKAIVQDADNVVKVFLTSRNDTQIQALLGDVSSVHIHEDDVRLDMKTFVGHAVRSRIQARSLLDGDVPPELETDLIQSLTNGAGEMYGQFLSASSVLT